MTERQLKPLQLVRYLLLAMTIAAVAALPFLSSARSNNSATITITNNSSREIVHVYLSHVDQDDWGPNQLGEETIPAGQSHTFSDVSWDGSQIKLNVEDRDGCFLNHVSPGSGSDSWTLTNSDPANCGND